MRPSVLVVDDDLGTREVMTTFLHLEGFDGVATANGQEALTYLRGGGHAAVILLDLAMPVMNGWEFRGHQKKDPALASIPVIVITATGSARERAGLMGVEEILLKPIHLDQLLSVIACATSGPRTLH